jgi:hypothetical protein
MGSTAILPDDLSHTIEGLGQRIAKKWSKRNLPWYAEEKARSGSFAAFAGLEIVCGLAASRVFRCVALGDCCLFFERDGVPRRAFPMEDADEFGNRPLLIPSRPPIRNVLENAPALFEQDARPGDVFLLMSDAIAQWYLRHAWSSLSLRSRLHMLLRQCVWEDLAGFVEHEREAGRLRNDDVAIVRVALLPCDPAICDRLEEYTRAEANDP